VIRRCVIVVLCAVLAGCSGGSGVGSFLSANKAPDDSQPPKNPRKEIADLLSTSLEDPTNIKDAFITEPMKQPSGLYYLCVKFNTRDANRQYKGIEERVAYFHQGVLNQLVPAEPSQCAKAAYQPYPEITKLCLINKCE
jgi:hypothetical protein